MSLFESSPQPMETDISNMNISEMMDILFNQDVDMGVCRDFYDPLYNEKQQKQREQEQAKIDDLKKRLAQHEAQYFTIDAETGEKIPNTAGLIPPPLQSQTSLSQDLDELGRMINIDELDIVSYLQDQATPQPLEPQQPQQMYSSQPQQADNDPWQTKVEWFNGDTGYQPMPAQSGSAVENSDPSSDYFDFIESSQDSSSYEQKYVLDDIDIDVDMVLGESSSSSFVSYRQASDSSTAAAGGSFQTQAFGGSISSQAPSSGSDSGGDLSPFTPDSSDGQNSGSSSDGSKAGRNVSRDVEKCKELNIPFSVEAITNCPVEEFNSMIRDYQMSEEQLGLIKDIRRRGKNKVAAQNCRKKKQSELSGLESEINDLHRRRNALVRDKAQLAASKTELEIQMGRLHQEIFSSLRDESGNPYDPRYFELDVTEDGEVGIVPKFFAPPKFELSTSAAYTLLDLSMKG